MKSLDTILIKLLVLNIKERDTGITVNTKSWISSLWSQVIYSVQYLPYLFIVSLASKLAVFSKEIVTTRFLYSTQRGSMSYWFWVSLSKLQSLSYESQEFTGRYRGTINGRLEDGTVEHSLQSQMSSLSFKETEKTDIKIQFIKSEF